ncbi:hypothetical protein WM40_24480 [Robbsia andropogonis]|uniref:Uncharacterized protein n=1 Tax=Robbsia andropogonis TaxID=28092 RepID=A0A0F5JUB1_9BURK|nr:hypothetical protein [Robbsia andropogonis]KKB61209.1 hypothetical protein WM40_24480 [Robbsia andropogonis]
MAVIVVPWWRKVAKQWSTWLHAAGLVIFLDAKAISEFLYDNLPDIWRHIPDDLRGTLAHWIPGGISGAILAAGLVVKFTTTRAALDQARAIGATPEPIQPPPPPPAP